MKINFHNLQVPLCSPEKMKCVASVNIEEESNCQKKCSGLLVTTFDKHQVKEQFKQFVQNLSTEYWNYKGYYKFPSQYKGIYNTTLFKSFEESIFKNLKWRGIV